MPVSESVLRRFADVVGADNVEVDPDALRRASTTTFAASQRVAAVVRPLNRQEVQACLGIARRERLPVYPVSRGKNWGFGSRVPVRDDSVLLDLGRMDRIVAFDEELAWVTVEPGVSFGQLYAFLRARRSRLFVSTTGASPDASVLANALERGDGCGPYGDRANHACALEVVLATGECVHTGFARFADTPLAPLHRWGVGAAFDGLFSQSNLGVVTQMTLWLTPLPRSLHAIRFSVVDPARLPQLVDALRGLRQDGTLLSSVGIWNDYRVLSAREQYPWPLAGGRTPLARAAVEAIRHKWGGARWFGTAAIYAASVEQGHARRLHVEGTLAPFVDHLSIDERHGEPISGEELFLEDDPAFLFLQGIPHQESLKSLYWRKRMPVPDDRDPDRDRCGVVWACPVLPFRGRDVATAAQLVERVLPEHGFEPLIAMIAQTERTIYLVPVIVYDRDVVGEDERAMRCHDAVLAGLIESGYLPYRLGIQSMDALPPPRDDHGALLCRVKRALDPDDILAPGRYDFRSTWPKEDA